MSCIVGIDEAGRGPLAGPVAVGAVKVRTGFGQKFFKGIRDSKQLSAAEREDWFELALEAKKKGELDFCVSLVSHSVIDRHGIAYAIRLGIKRCLTRLEVSELDQIFLDGGLKASERFTHQLTVVKGDEKIPIVSLASICAKVVRDRRMVRVGKAYPEYGFEVHKGYGTEAHRAALRKHGVRDVHRKSFLKNIDK